MNAIFPQGLDSYLNIALVFFRLLGFFLFLPGLSHKAIPPHFKVLLGFTISLVLYPVVKEYLPTLTLSPGSLLLGVIRESTVGFLMGFVAYLTFEAIHLASQFIGYQMGLGTIGLMDPMTATQTSALVPLYGWIALMVFFFLDLHHEMLELFSLSFIVTQKLQSGVLVNGNVLEFLITVSGQLFVYAVRLSLPFTVLILACNVAIGILARLLPQMNVILFAFPITILVGMAALFLLVPDLINALDGMLSEMSVNVMQVLKRI